MESRLVDLEVRYTHLERQVAKLNQVVFEQQRAIDYLKTELGAARGRIEALGEPMANDPPPHY